MTDTDYRKMLAQLERHEGKRLEAGIGRVM